ncbi:MAG: aspartate--tRNA ligase [Aquificota bacterium]|jgi:aspartyl-tRNA synthetase|uniref:Aspartate--tRNA(Asp/Asn) ligase n=1 Tax=Hydrogenobacter sp. TaxID=2152829 RepID=A0A7C2VAJ6_9AQUI|nr:aspartate--tRNA ligase [Aquificaceae bacterium]MDM7266721.1 aspartate--tRNA ligase [Aquificaceae bacterium]QWK13816.1 MAG: aspartate--tRNA ligase [Aquificota bacterium]HCO39389.1 aspartate--tRNA ligase [Aquificaceae bacterium]
MLKRTKYCGHISEEDLNKEVILNGWVHRIRNHGGVIFIDLRDREGIVQCVVEEKDNPKVYDLADSLKSEYVVAIRGKVRRRPPGTENQKLKTGYYEVVIEELEILNTSEVPPFPIDEETPISEETKLRYRYLDLRRESMKENLLFRHRAYQVARKVFVEEGFVEIETPFLTKSTPEGARDFLVPSRLHPGKFYALPQSPQLFKQILMVAGFDRYFQIVKCLRDEDLRADRQPEFTQIDFEMSFVDEEDVMAFSERLIATLFKELLGIELKRPFDRMPYREAMERYGSDKPDRRFGLELIDLTDIFSNTEFKVFRQAIDNGGVVKAINFKGSNLSRKEIDELTQFVQSLGAKGLAWIKVEEDKLNSPIVKFFSQEETQKLLERVQAEVGDVIFFSADKREMVYKVLGSLRLHIGKKYNLINTENFDVFWVVDFPLMEWDEEEKRFVSLHHPFTSPREEDIPLLKKALEVEDLEEKKKLVHSVRARAYDLVINGYEVGGGSIRIHRREVQELVFRLLQISDMEAREKFGFLLDALKYGAPPHGGLAFGFDRLLAIMRGLDSIRDVIAFPKTQKGICPLTGAPDYVDPKQLKELHVKVVE